MAKEDELTAKDGILILLAIIVIGAVLLVGGLWGWAQYDVYSSELRGRAMLKKAESERQVQIEDAKGKEQAAKMLANAEVERARGVAEANKIIGSSLKDNPEYLTWLWIEKVSDNQNSVIYIPTEAGIPILEAGRTIDRTKKPEPKK